MNHVHWLSEGLTFPNFGAKVFDDLLNGRLETPDGSLGEERIECVATEAVRLVGNCPKSHVVASKHSGGPLGLLDVFGYVRIQLRNKRIVVHVELIGVDAYYIA